MSDRPEVMRDRPPSGEIIAPLPPMLWPARTVHEGRYARLEPLDVRVHAEELYAASHSADDMRKIWDYMPYGPWPTIDAFSGWLRDCSASADPLFFAVRDQRTGRASGMTSYLSIHPKMGSIEIGNIWFGPALQNTPAATETHYLLIQHAFDLGYRRMEWKCDALNRASRQAATRLGFAYEGTFYQHMIRKGRNRDTAWFSILDREWPAIRANFEAWLAPGNFDESGNQRSSLGELNRMTRQAME